MQTGLIVAGGRSTRFGDRDKALADLAGTPMIRRVADRITGAVDAVVVNCRTDQVDDIESALTGVDADLTFAPDERPDEGPLAGIATGLRTAESEYTLVVACDMPFLDPEFAQYLFERAANHDAAVPRPDDWLQPMQAVYRTEPTRTACERALARGDRRAVAPLNGLDYVVVDRGDIESHTTLESLRNLNTRAEFERARERF